MMTSDPLDLDEPLRRSTDDDLARPLPAALLEARAEVVAAARDVLAIPEPALEAPWSWIGEGEADVRYGAYRAAEALEAAEIEARTVLGASAAKERAAARATHGGSGPLTQRWVRSSIGSRTKTGICRSVFR